MKKIIYIIIALLLVNINVFALERTDLDNLGVNKKWVITNNNRDNVLKTKLVDAKDKIYDFSNVLTDEEEKHFKELSINFSEKYNMELIIVTDNVPYTYDDRNTEYATDFYDYNDFGLHYPHYSGILLFRNTYELDPYYDMFLFGDAQLYFTQGDMDRILDNIYDDLHSGNYQSGFDYFFNESNTILNRDERPSELQKYDIDDNGFLVINKEYAKKAKLSTNLTISGIVSVVICAVFTVVNILKNRLVTKVNEANQYLDLSKVKYSIKTDVLTSTHTTSHYNPPSSSSSGGGFHSSSGGGFSSGGGRHG